MTTKKSVFEILSAINVNEHVKSKNGLSYLSWVWAWGVTKEVYPDTTYKVINFDGKPFCFDENLGYMVQTEVTIQGEALPMHLFVMNGANKAQKHVEYMYKTKYGDKFVEPATMFDVNTAIMRCLTKNLALFGLGHYIYAGEDIPQEELRENQERIEEERLEKERKQAEVLSEMIALIEADDIAFTQLWHESNREEQGIYWKGINTKQKKVAREMLASDEGKKAA